MSTQESGQNSHGAYEFIVNSVDHHTNDPILQGRQLLSLARFDPADEHVLIQQLDRETRSIGLDEEIDLRGERKKFHAFRSDREYRFVLNELGCEWGDARISERELRVIGQIDPDAVLFLDRQDEPDRELGPDDEVNLAERGTEHIRSKKRLVTVFFKNKPYRLAPGTYTTEQLMAEFPIEEGYLLNLKNEQGELVTLQPGQRTTIKNGMHFYSQVPGGGSS